MDLPAAPETRIYEFGPFRLDMSSRVLLRDGRMVPLPPKVLDTLVLLIANHGRLVPKDELLRLIWPGTYVDENNLMHNVSVLRKVLGDAPDGKPYIETAPRRGYRFTADVRIAGNGVAVRTETAPVPRRRWFVALSAVLIASLVAAALSMKSALDPALRVTPLTSYPGTEASPTFSPDGLQVAFIWNGEKQDQFDIYVKTIGSEPARRLTSDPEPECHLAWSPDGKWIAFIHCGVEAGAPPGSVGLYVISSAGGPKRRIAYLYNAANPFERPFTWTSDSRGLISAKGIGGSADAGLLVLPLDAGTPPRQLTWPQRGTWDDGPAVSPDGRNLAFVHWISHGLADIYVVPLDRQSAPRGRERRITFENDFILNLVWTVDGSELLYASGSEGARGVWRVRARPGAVPRQVPALAQAGIQFTLSRDGKLAYSRRYWDFDVWRAGLDASAGQPAALIASTFSDAEPRYSPDGKSIAFASNRTGAMEIWRSNADGTGVNEVTSLRAESGSPAWSPDGKEIAFDCRSGPDVQIYLAGASGGGIRRLTSDSGVHTTPAWSRDGRWIYFASKRTGRLEVWRVPSSGGGSTQVTTSGGFFAAESRDGKSLFYARSSDFPTSLWRKSLETGTEQQLIDSIGNWFAFDVFDAGIYFVPGRTPARNRESFQIWFYDFANRGVRSVAEIDKPPGIGFSISPDRRSVLFAPSETHAANLVLIDRFR